MFDQRQRLNLRKQALALPARCMDRGLEATNPLARTLVMHVHVRVITLKIQTAG